MKTKDELAAEQAAYWKGAGGTMWLGAYDRIQRGIAGFTETALEATNAQPGERALDVGCGTGGTTADLAKAVGAKGHVLGADISEPLVEAARARGLGNATFEVADATTHAFEPASFDLAFSRFGVMFFGDPVAAFQNIRRALKPSGRLVFLCWRTAAENAWSAVPMRAAQRFLAPMARPGPEDPGQYSFGDRSRVERILTQAGFNGLSIEPVDQMMNSGQGHPRRAATHRRLRPAGARVQGPRARADRQGQGGDRRGAETPCDGGRGRARRRLLAGSRPSLMEHIRAFPLPPVSLVLGGARSGKSTHAERLVTGSLHGAAPQAAVYIATAQAGDVEMATRIMAHRARRGGNWTTLEEPLKLDEALASAAGQGRPVLVDCLTLWLSNLMLGGGDVDEATDDLLRTLDEVAVPVVFVSNEVGLGIVPDTPLGRSFRDAQGRLNMRMADRADRVILMTAGLPQTLKDRPSARG